VLIFFILIDLLKSLAKKKIIIFFFGDEIKTKNKKIMDQSVSNTAPGAGQTVFSISTAFQAVPLVFLICLWIYVYNNGAKMNTGLIEAIYALAWITLLITFYKVYKIANEIMKIPNEKVKLAMWVVSTSVIVYMIVFLCIVISAFSHQGKNATKFMGFLNAGSWVFFISLMVVPFDMGIAFATQSMNKSLDQSSDFLKELAGNAKAAISRGPQLAKRYYDKLSNAAGSVANAIPYPGEEY